MVDGQSGNRDIAVGDTVTGTGVSGTVTVSTVTDQNNLVLSSNQSIPDNVTLTFTPSIKCNYVDKPTTASFDYVVVNGEPLYNSTNSVDFELHESEETELVLKILEISGIAIKDPLLYQQAAQEVERKT